MDESDPPMRGHGTVLDHAGELRRRIAALAEAVAVTEDHLACAFEESARLRPHAAPRLLEAARRARLYADEERRYARSQAGMVPPAGDAYVG